jgi:D-tyrosyl-tRNA(Tyr) deacylase
VKLVLQRVSSAKVRHQDQTRLEIKRGILILAGVEPTDTCAAAESLAKRVGDLRLFEDANGETTLTIKDVKGEFLVLPQPMLSADLSTGHPREVESGDAQEIFDWFCGALGRVRPCKCGVLGLPMSLQITNEGPATYLLET